MRRVLHIISQYPGKTGSGIYLNELIREADKKGYEQALIAAIDDESYESPYIDQDRLYLLEFNSEKLPFPIFGMSDEMPYRSKKYLDMTELELELYKQSFYELIDQALDEFKPDIIISHHLWLLTSMLEEVDREIKIVGLSHGTDIRQLNSVDSLREEVIDGCQRLDLVLALNQEQKEEIEELYSIEDEKIMVIGGGYNSDLFYPGPDSFEEKDRLELIYAGKISRAKGLISLLKAVDNLEIDRPIRLRLAGSGVGKQYRDIVEFGEGLSREDREIVFLGEISQAELADCFRESDIFIMPSYYEGLSLVTIEALASGLLTSCSSIEGLMSYLGDNINNSGIIDYVALPNMEAGYLDRPREDELDTYIANLTQSIEDRILSLDKSKALYKSVRDDLLRLSWEGIFTKIETYIEDYI